MEEDQDTRSIIWDRLMAQLSGWDESPDGKQGAMALANAIWLIFPEYRDNMKQFGALSVTPPQPQERQQ